jgi:1,4-dihydroxy-2-naphthoate polyprenyltransferase
VHLMSLPIALSVFNVILINEFPDYPADLMEGKKTMTVRFGKKTASYVYAAACLGGVALYPLSLLAGLSPYTILLYLPIIALSIMVTTGMLMQRYKDRAALEKMCGITIVINWLYAAAFMLGLWIWGI